MDNGHMGGVVVPPCFSPQIFKQKKTNQKGDQQKPLSAFLKPWLHHTAKLMSA